MSKRRGKILTDSESVERRKWYNDLQMATMQEVAQENAAHKQQHLQDISEKDVQINNGIPPINFHRNPWFSALNTPRKTKAVVLFFHGIGQNQAFYKRWHKEMSNEDVLLCSVCLPGRSSRAGEFFADSIRNASVAIFIALRASRIIYRPVLSTSEPTTIRPLVLFGNDIGALIAYEVAKILQNYHYHLTALIAVAAPSPYLQGQNRLGKKHCFLSDTELQQKMIELGGVPYLLRERKELLKYFIPLFRSDFFLFDTYTIQPPATVLLIPEDDLEASLDLQPPVREPAVVKKPQFGRVALVETEEQQEELIYPVVLYRIHCPVVTMRVEDDPFVTDSEVSEWAHLSDSYEHIVLDAAGPGAHCNGLCTSHNEISVTEQLLRFCALTSVEPTSVNGDEIE